MERRKQHQPGCCSALRLQMLRTQQEQERCLRRLRAEHQEKQERFVRSESDAGEGDSSGSSSIDRENDLEKEEGKTNSSDNGMWKVLMEEGGDILEELTPCDTRVLVHSEEELSQCETFERIFPTPDTGHYLQYIDTNYYDLLLVAWEKRYAKDRQTGQDRLETLTAEVRNLKTWI